MLIKVPQGQAIEYPGEGTLKEILVQENKELLKQYIAARAGDERVDFHTQLTSEAEVELIPWDADEAAWIYRHSMSHVLAQAVLRLFPDAQLAIGPAIDDGFYYDFDVAEPFTPEDLRKIEREMKRVVKQNHKFERIDVARQEAEEMVANAPYKQEILADLEEGQTLSFYKDGEFIDLCRGPHMLGTGQVKHFKLLSVAGAYWRGDESRKMLQRIYGTAFATREALDHHLAMLEEAKKRDHRTLGKQLELFTFDDEVGPGLPLWLPKGAVLIDELEDLARKTEGEAGYQRVRTPHICKESIYLRSGHLPYYAESMFPPMELEGVKYYLKPMNCPHHHKIFAAAPALVPRLASAFGRVWHVLSLRAIGRVVRLDAGALVADERRAHLLHPRPIRGGIPRRLPDVSALFRAVRLGELPDALEHPRALGPRGKVRR